MKESNTDLFFRFMYERQMIWHKRYVLKLPPPWTDNKILQNNKFTNIHRELDRGTIFYVRKVYPEAMKIWAEDLGRAEKNLIWYTVIYRLLNRRQTFEKVGFIPYWVWNTTTNSHRDLDPNKGTTTAGKHWFDALKEMMDRGQSIFTSAHRTCPTHKPGQTRLEVFRESVEYLKKNLPDLWESVKRSRSLEEVFKVLKQIPNVGDFISYEICCDFMLVKLIPFREDDWVNPGPGCRAGLKLLFSDLDKHDTKKCQELVTRLKDNQETHFYKLGLMDSFKEICFKRLTLRSVEHSLCEFSKYHRCLKGGHTRVGFKPSQEEYGQWPLRFARTR